MEWLIAIGVLFGAWVVYGIIQQNKWNNEYTTEIGRYYKLSPEQSKGKKSFNGTCYFDEMAKPINVGLRLPKGEKIYGAFQNISLMAYKRDGRVGAYGITLRKKVVPGVYLRGGLGKFGLAKSWQVEATGNLYFTNQGIFFDGDKKNIKLKWDKMMRETIDANEIQIEKQNGEPILFQGTISPEEAAKFTLMGQAYESF